MSETSLDYVDALKIAESVMAGIANDEFIGKFYRKGIEGTPLVNDIAVRMALSMQDTFNQQTAELVQIKAELEVLRGFINDLVDDESLYDCRIVALLYKWRLHDADGKTSLLTGVQND
jgi:hypothetical protein